MPPRNWEGRFKIKHWNSLCSMGSLWMRFLRLPVSETRNRGLQKIELLRIKNVQIFPRCSAKDLVCSTRLYLLSVCWLPSGQHSSRYLQPNSKVVYKSWPSIARDLQVRLTGWPSKIPFPGGDGFKPSQLPIDTIRTLLRPYQNSSVEGDDKRWDIIKWTDGISFPQPSHFLLSTNKNFH